MKLYDSGVKEAGGGAQALSKLEESKGWARVVTIDGAQDGVDLCVVASVAETEQETAQHRNHGAAQYTTINEIKTNKLYIYNRIR